MSFREKSAVAELVSVGALAVWYFAALIGEIGRVSLTEIGYQGRLVVMVILLGALIVATHVLIAVTDPGTADENDERDRRINRTGEYLGGFALATGSVVALGLAMTEAPYFFISHAILGGLVLSEVVSGVSKLVMYRRGI